MNIIIDIFLNISRFDQVTGILGGLDDGLPMRSQYKVNVKKDEIDLNALPNSNDELEQNGEDNNNKENCGASPSCLGISGQEFKKIQKIKLNLN